MVLPPNYKNTVRDGIAALRRREVILTRRAEREREPGPTLLTLRDVGGLADRLEDLGDWEWENGFGSIFLGGQDFAVLLELIEENRRPSPYSSDSTASSQLEDGEHLEALRDFLTRYSAGQFLTR